MTKGLTFVAGYLFTHEVATQAELIRPAGELHSRRPQDFAGREKSMYKGSKVFFAALLPEIIPILQIL